MLRSVKAVFGLLFILSLFALSGCDNAPESDQQEVLLQGKTMGTTFNIKVFVPQQQLPQLNLYADVTEELKKVNQSMSTYIEDSEINQFNRLPAGDVMPISSDFRAVVSESIRLGQSTKALDVTMGPLIDLWGFGPDKRPTQRPEQAELDAMLANIGVDKLVLSEQGLAKTVDGLELSFSATAKGYGIDKVAELLQSHGLTNYMVEIGGEMRISGHKPDNKPWRIAIEQPDAPPGQRKIHRVVEPGSMGVATSGDYRIFYEMDGETYTHLIDPQTGMPIKHDLVSVTVLHPSAMTADGLATALTVMGTEQAKAYAEQHNLPVYLISKTDSGLQTHASTAFKPYL
ncbi:FAD:protein FMN transferase [Pseudoalteromonas ruthenica]|uniref:FAD:protein FMN transferase n=1 Tax=Pseudoalteromonas ruthenica TaxID=151081 RepID=UPI00241F9818|nr:FAD:protein FMN transferase [Pseudoalteromonas ruthenica]|tara:strand:+ start:133826 stop:134857 length:1032 start_codon:yes stop_codon:yes gene_type:complete